MPESKRIVVDASVARSAGSGKKANEFSGPSRAVLNSIETHHVVAFSSHCFQEWDEHERDFARRWRRRMVGAKKVVYLREITDEELRERLAGAVEFLNERRAILKDAHLIEAALLMDRIVISQDEKVRDLFRRSALTVDELQAVLWANPEIEAEQVVLWLNHGAKEEPARRLGAPLG